jgi:alkylation response protein AidB-like acyl-CoA dehydrogenase
MDFTPTEAQDDLAGLARRILGDHAAQHEATQSGFDRPLWTSLARAGLLDAALPSAVGGGGFGLLEQCSILVEIGRTLTPAPYLSSIVAGAAAVAELGDGRLAERWVLPVTRGERTLAAALADETPAFTAERTADGWRLHGVQTAVPAGAFADGFLCEASTNDGAVLLLVDRTADGVVVSEQHVVDGTDAAQLELTDVVVPAEARLGDDPAWVRQRMTVGVCAHQFGVLERALELTAEYAKTREQFGHPIGSFQAVRQRLADAYLDVEAVRLTLWQAAWRLAAGMPAEVEVATAKFWAAEAGHRVAHTCVHVHGGVGIDTDYPLHRYFVAAKRNEFTLGAATAQLRAIGAQLAAEPA